MKEIGAVIFMFDELGDFKSCAGPGRSFIVDINGAEVMDGHYPLLNAMVHCLERCCKVHGAVSGNIREDGPWGYNTVAKRVGFRAEGV